ncbi:MAG: hypothetical protein V2B19_16190 [Pseudomonadota bacterium]
MMKINNMYAMGLQTGQAKKNYRQVHEEYVTRNEEAIALSTGSLKPESVTYLLLAFQKAAAIAPLRNSLIAILTRWLEVSHNLERDTLYSPKFVHDRSAGYRPVSVWSLKNVC